jgi:hypothetical protein
MRFPQLVIALLLLFGSVNADQNWEGWAGPGDQTKWPSPSYTPKVVDVDVAIIGGGSGGIHAAIQLKDAGASVMVIEKKDQIGGHTETYTNPSTGVVSNVGVTVFENTDLVKRYFARLGVPIITNSLETPSARYDFALGIPIPPPDDQQEVIQAAVQAYTENVLSKYGWIDQGFLVPDPVPEELYLPFAQFAENYNFSLSFLLSHNSTGIREISQYSRPCMASKASDPACSAVPSESSYNLAQATAGAYTTRP